MTPVFSHPIYFWLALAMVAAILEMVVPWFGFILASGAAVIAALSAEWFATEIQIATFAVVLLVSLLFLRPFLLKRRHSGHKIHSRADALKGLSGQVTEAIDPHSHLGRVSVAGQDWAAKADAAVAAGKIVVVTGSDGIVLIVKEV